MTTTWWITKPKFPPTSFQYSNMNTPSANMYPVNTATLTTAYVGANHTISSTCSKKTMYNALHVTQAACRADTNLAFASSFNALEKFLYGVKAERRGGHTNQNVTTNVKKEEATIIHESIINVDNAINCSKLKKDPLL